MRAGKADLLLRHGVRIDLDGIPKGRCVLARSAQRDCIQAVRFGCYLSLRQNIFLKKRSGL